MELKCKFIPVANNTMDLQPKTEGAAGLDLIYNGTEDVILDRYNKSFAFPTGFYVEIPKGYFGMLVVRSSIGFKLGLSMPNDVGIIDSDYRGEIKCKLYNTDPENSVTITPGQRIAQLIIIPYIMPTYTLVEELNDTTRGESGFGSTGK